MGVKPYLSVAGNALSAEWRGEIPAEVRGRLSDMLMVRNTHCVERQGNFLFLAVDIFLEGEKGNFNNIYSLNKAVFNFKVIVSVAVFAKSNFLTVYKNIAQRIEPVKMKNNVFALQVSCRKGNRFFERKMILVGNINVRRLVRRERRKVFVIDFFCYKKGRHRNIMPGKLPFSVKVDFFHSLSSA